MAIVKRRGATPQGDEARAELADGDIASGSVGTVNFMEKRDFDGVLAILMQWIDRPVAVGIDGPGDGGLATMRGTLRAARDIAKPFDEEEFEFTVSEDPVCGFSLHHGYFDGADYFEDSQLIVQLTENAGGWRSSVVIHVVLHGSALA